MIKKILRGGLYLVYLVAISLVILELIYRNYWIDFYRPELLHQNDAADLSESSKPTILVFGDSFTASKIGYVSTLRDSFENHRVINAGISGTTVVQNLLPLKSRVREFSPEVIVYQVYLGNDILEFRHPTDSDRIGVVRRIYWWLSDRIRVLGFLNYRFLHVRQKIYQDLPISWVKKDRSFDEEYYSARTKMHIRTEPRMLEDVVSMGGDRYRDVVNYVKRLKRHLNRVSKSTGIVLVIVPHCAQVSEKYRSRMQRLGAKLTDPKLTSEVDYIFMDYLRQMVEYSNIRILNPLLEFRKAEEKYPLYWENDPHLNIEGQALLGEILVNFMVKEGIGENKRQGREF